MSERRNTSTGARAAATALGVAAGAYLAYVATTWVRYGRPSAASDDERDELLDRVMPRYDVVERHRVAIAAPAAITSRTARAIDISRAPIPRALFKARALILGSRGTSQPPSRGLIADMQALGWGVIADIPDREIVMGAVTKPWEAEPVFRTLSPDAFVTFDEPDYVKIAWTLRADAIDSHTSIFRTETRALATDARARARFRWYWSWLSPGIVLIRWAMLHPLKAAAERDARRAMHVV